MPMKKRIIAFLLLGFCLAVLPARAAMARAGGGGGTAGGGGGGGGTAGRPTFSESGQASSPISQLFDYLLFGAFVSGGAVVFFVRVHAKGAKISRIMKLLAATDPSWSFESYKKDIEHIFYAVQNAWMERNQNLAKDCLSSSLYDQYRIKSEWMTVRHEKDILKSLKLLEAIPVDIADPGGTENDSLWVYIKARAADYTVDDRTMALKSGSKVSKTFEEYWKLIKENSGWVLDEIRQKNEVNLDAL